MDFFAKSLDRVFLVHLVPSQVGPQKYLPCGRVPGFAPIPPSPSATLMAEAEKMECTARFSLERKTVIWLCGEGSTLCS